MKRTATQTEIAAFERRIRELMAEGYSVKFAVYQAYKEHPVMQTLQREVGAQIRTEAERGYGDSLPQGITDRLFTHSWTPDGLTLSERTTHASILVREMVARTISEQIKKSATYRKASLAIFDGYKIGGVIPVQDVPKYLAETTAIARHASIPRDEILKMLKPIRRQIEKGTTAGMRAAYSQLVDALEDQNEKALNKAIYAATQGQTIKGQYKRLPPSMQGKPLFMRLSGLKTNGIVFYAAPAFRSVLLRLYALYNAMPESTLALGA